MEERQAKRQRDDHSSIESNDINIYRLVVIDFVCLKLTESFRARKEVFS